jgi:hypothetical protein
MVVSGTRVSGRPSNEPSERAVANHLAVIYDMGAATTGRLVGFIRENDVFDANAGLAGARVVLSTGEERVTDARGFYEFAAVAPGDVTVDVTLDGFVPGHDVKTVLVGTTNWKSIALVRGAPDAGVPVAADAGVIEADAGENDAAIETADAGVEPEPEPEPDPDPVPDAGVAIEDTLPPADDGGCICLSGRPGPSAWIFMLAGIGLLLIRSRR